MRTGGTQRDVLDLPFPKHNSVLQKKRKEGGRAGGSAVPALNRTLTRDPRRCLTNAPHQEAREGICVCAEAMTNDRDLSAHAVAHVAAGHLGT